MIDTIKVESPSISEEIAFIIENSSIIRAGIDVENGELLYKFTTKELKGSYDSSIRISVEREKYVTILDNTDKNQITIKKPCDPFLIIECSIHKFFLGHNVYGGSDNLEYQFIELKKFIEDTFDIKLPFIYQWKVRRIDYARVYNLGDDIVRFFEGFSNVYYPRRVSMKYGTTGLYFPGSFTTLKLYDKGVEFKKHDKKKLIHFMNNKDLKKLEDISQGKLRIELEIKARKLKHIYGDLPYITEIKMADIKSQFEIELKRIFKVSENNMKLYNNSQDVEKILFNMYGTSGNIYLGTWYRLSINGYDSVKKSMSESTFYRHITKLKDANISWNHTDVITQENKVIEFVFNPFNTDLEVTEDLIAS